MDPRRRDEPSLDNILMRDFAELGVGEANIAHDEPVNEDDSKAGEHDAKEPNQPSPPAYNQVIDAVEDRTSFVVNTPPTTAEQNSGTVNSTSDSKNRAPVLSAPTQTLGDDFDVDW